MTSPLSTPAWIAAPMATTSSGLTPLCGSLPKTCLTISWTAGMRVWPPTRTTSSMSLGLSPASLSACWTGPLVRSTRSPTSCSSLARVRFSDRCFGPLASAVMKGRLISVRLRRAELDLGLLGGFLEPLQGHAVLAQVDALVLLELVDDPVDDALVEVVAAQERVAVGGLDFEDALAHAQDRDVEGAAAQVVDGDDLVFALLVEAVGQRRGGRLVDDAQDFQAGDLAGILGRLALAVVEVGRAR